MPRSQDGRWDIECGRPGCARTFTPSRAKQVYCSRECAEEDRGRWARPAGGTHAVAGLEPRVCPNPECGREFQPVRRNQLACSRKCRDKLPQQLAKIRAYDRSPERRMRANEMRRPSSDQRSPERIEKIRQRNRIQALARAGWTVEEYDQAHAEQWGCCAICGKPAAGKGAHSKLHADHDHKTGKRRALLCSNCNVGIGLFDDDPDLLLAAINYIFLYRGQAAVTLGRSSSGGQSPRSAGN